MAFVPHLALVPGSARGSTTSQSASDDPPVPAREEANARRHDARLRGLVDRHIDLVARVLRNAGTPSADVDDEVQRAFIIASKRLDDVRPGAEKSFLVQIALHLAAHARRTLARRREVPEHEAPERVDALATPEQLTDRKRARAMLDRVLDQMETDLRTVFVLHEFEEMSMAEIATALRIPPGTVASRLRRARVEFRARAAALQNAPGRAGRAILDKTKGGSEP